MNKFQIMIFLKVSVLTVGCTTYPSIAPADSDCPDASIKRINVIYKRNQEILVRPSEKRVNRGDAVMYVVQGRKDEPDLAWTATGTNGPGPFAWLNSSGTGNKTNISEIRCVDLAQAPGEYKYEIKVADVGVLDPVVHVE